MDTKKSIGYVVNHGHMDIEWYMPLHSFRFWTVEALDELRRIARENPEYGTYVLDGQTCVLDIYLEARPAAREEIKSLIKNGTLSIGPFYSQFDEWLISGESMIRNCLYGNRSCKEYGAIMKAGYLPDNFGHPLQLPQILNNFGIDSLLFMRGMPEIPGGHPDEFMYTGIDGSRVFASHFRDGYGGAFGMFDRPDVPDLQLRDMPYHADYYSYEQLMELADHTDPEKIAKELIRNVQSIKNRYPSGVVPLIAGADHCPPQGKMGETILLANRMQDEIEFVMGSAEGYVRTTQARLNNPREFDQELIGSRYQNILFGAQSTRTYLKRANFGVEALLERYAEPLDALATMLGDYPDARPQFDEAWKLMMINSAHDSIHGTSMDEVHVEMEGRFSAAAQIATGLAHEGLKHVGRHIHRWWQENETAILTFAPADAGIPQIANVWLPVGDENVCVYDKNGTALPTQVLPREHIEKNSLGQPRNSSWPGKKTRNVLFLASSGSNTVDSFVLKPTVSQFANITASDTFIDNEYIRVEVVDALINILDKKTGIWNKGLNLIEEDADAGDAWDYAPTSKSSETVLSNAFPFVSRLIQHGPVCATIEIKGAMIVPYQLIGDERSTKRAEIPMCFEVSLHAGTPRVDVKLRFENNAKDHRLRLKVPAGIQTDSILSQSVFGAIKRPVAHQTEGANWHQPPTRVFPFREWLAVDNGKTGLAVAVKGIYDYEPLVNPVTGSPDIYLTLLRGIEYMGRLNITTRHDEASRCHHTPGAQCPGMQVIEWSYIPFCVESADVAPFVPQVQTFLFPLMTHMVRAKQVDITLCKEFKPFEILDRDIQFSAFKRAFDGHGYVLRFFENQGVAKQVKIGLKGFRKAFMSNMNEEVLDDITIGPDGAVTVAMGAFKVVTLFLEQ